MRHKIFCSLVTAIALFFTAFYPIPARSAEITEKVETGQFDQAEIGESDQLEIEQMDQTEADRSIEQDGQTSELDDTGVKAAAQEIISGKCGENVSWELAGGLLTISGTGNMDVYTGTTSAPWSKYKDNITSVKIEPGVTSIGISAFYGCDRMTAVSIPSTVTVINQNAFMNCKKLKSLTLPSGVVSVWGGAFCGCSSLKKVKISDSVQSIWYRAFEGCSNLQEFTVEEGNAYFSSRQGALLNKDQTELIAYPASSALKSYTVPETVARINTYTFQDAVNLQEITLPKGLETVNDYTFYRCESLKTITIPSSVTEIGVFAFGECYSLEKVKIPSSVKIIWAYAFSDCRNLSSVTISEGVTTINDYAFQKCQKLSKIDIPSSVTEIGLSAFRFCRNLKSITIRNPECLLPDVDDLVNSTAVIYGCKNSTAQDYAKKYHRVFQLIGNKPVTKITISKKKLSLKAGKTATLKATVSPSNATSKKITWISSNPDVVSVSSKGKVKARSDGKATVMARSSNGKLASCAITVKGKDWKKYGSLDTVSCQDYKSYCSSTSLSGLTAISSGYMSVTAQKQDYSYEEKGIRHFGTYYKNILAEYYNKSFRRSSKKKIPMELSKFGGFYAGKDAYYLVFGQDNPKENNDVEVVRVVKYNKKWKRLSAVSLRGADTYRIFASGNLRMAEYKGRLVIRTCHTMYDKGDGLHHQGTLTIVVNTSDLKDMVWYNYDISHSFNQFIIADDKGHLITLDHGDANPRSAVLKEYDAGDLVNGNYEDLYFASERIHTLEFPRYKKIHYNYTGSTLGGLSYSSANYLTAGNSVAQNKKFETNKTRNIYITVTPRSKVSTAATKLKWITSYKEGGKTSASTPQLVKVSADSFLLLWERITNGQKSGKISYVYLNGKGAKTSKIYTKKGYLSDCQPIVSKGAVVWYVKNSGKTIFYKIKKNGTLKCYK